MLLAFFRERRERTDAQRAHWNGVLSRLVELDLELAKRPDYLAPVMARSVSNMSAQVADLLTFRLPLPEKEHRDLKLRFAAYIERAEKFIGYLDDWERHKLRPVTHGWDVSKLLGSLRDFELPPG